MKRLLVTAAEHLIPPFRRLRLQRDQIQDQLEKYLVSNRDLAVQERPPLSAAEEFQETQKPGDTPKRFVASPSEAAATQPGYAVVLTAGRTGTQWLATALNSHDDIFFSHGQDLRPVKRLTQSLYRDASARIVEQSKNFDFNNCDGYFDILEKVGSYKVYGNIHGILSPEMFLNPQNFHRRYRVLALVRNPIIRAASFTRKWHKDAAVSATAFLKSDREYCERACKKYPVNKSDPEDIIFLKAVQTTLIFDATYSRANIPLIPMERLVCDINYFLHVFAFLTSSLVDVDEHYIRKVVSITPFDVTVADDESIVPLLVAKWPPWRRRFFRDELEASGLVDTYLTLGYATENYLVN